MNGNKWPIQILYLDDNPNTLNKKNGIQGGYDFFLTEATKITFLPSEMEESG